MIWHCSDCHQIGFYWSDREGQALKENHPKTCEGRKSMDVHIYEKGKYVRTERDVRGPVYVDRGEGTSLPDATGDSTEPVLPLTRWPEGSEL